MQMPDKRITKFLFAVEAVGIVFVGVYLAAYLGGLFVLPQTTVFHSVPAVRLALSCLRRSIFSAYSCHSCFGFSKAKVEG